MRSRLVKLGTVAAFATMFVIAISVYTYAGDPTEYCAEHSNPSPGSGLTEANPILAEAHWMYFPVSGASCSWKMASDIRYVTTDIRAWYTIAILAGIVVLISSVASAVVSLLNSRR